MSRRHQSQVRGDEAVSVSNQASKTSSSSADPRQLSSVVSLIWKRNAQIGNEALRCQLPRMCTSSTISAGHGAADGSIAGRSVD
ncbi:hypothetical protein PHSY_006758 [Pseudozyma hubeiensis SY62]|uniref:Uncharacterized protein n=1 Tax=Pseudozyma hubeiensis (strain SY62) TaxID=1305764 RepID=R9PCR9_PSEHS|nr:hypothetical protein PHSY_006758 [Pseudozyma hubeiensis SY62]GAC99159.1 hypothetical protein PHSY_006758 [Pseudozyma hubeiensis SY62]